MAETAKLIIVLVVPRARAMAGPLQFQRSRKLSNAPEVGGMTTEIG